MIEGTQMTFDFLTSVNQTDTTALDAHNNTHGYDMAQVSPFPFEQLFIDAIDPEEIHNHNSMAVCGDSLQIMKQMKNGSVKLIFADAPYNIGKDFGNNSDKRETVQQYTNWCKLWIDECLRVLSDDGTMYFMTATQHMPYLDIYVSEKYNVLCRIVWTYDSSGVQSKKMFGSLYEPILMINKNAAAKYTFNRQDILVEAKTGSKRKLIDYRKNPPNHITAKKFPAMYGNLTGCVLKWKNTKTIRPRNRKNCWNASSKRLPTKGILYLTHLQAPSPPLRWPCVWEESASVST